jgi:hypothetical protein
MQHHLHELHYEAAFTAVDCALADARPTPAIDTGGVQAARDHDDKSARARRLGSERLR